MPRATCTVSERGRGLEFEFPDLVSSVGFGWL